MFIDCISYECLLSGKLFLALFSAIAVIDLSEAKTNAAAIRKIAAKIDPSMTGAKGIPQKVTAGAKKNAKLEPNVIINPITASLHAKSLSVPKIRFSLISV